MLIFLLGMMGAGKSTLGRELAAALQCTFIDLDEYIIARVQKTIAELFEQHGPDKFRVLERQALEAVTKEYTNAVIATGGGTPCFFDNMAFINSKGKSIFLDVPAQEIFNRLKATDLTARPLLACKTDAALKEFITTTLAHRMEFYRQAHHTISSNSCTAKELLAIVNNK